MSSPVVVMNAPKHMCGMKGLKTARLRKFAIRGCPACALDEHLGLRESKLPGAKVAVSATVNTSKKCPSCGHGHTFKSLCKECRNEGKVCRGYPA